MPFIKTVDHPSDVLERKNFQAKLVALRKKRRMNREAAASTFGISPRYIQFLETSFKWRVLTLQRYLSLYGHDFDITIHDMYLPPLSEDCLSLMKQGDEFRGRYITKRLREIREDQGISQRSMETWLNLHNGSMNWFEVRSNDPLVSNVQRYVRGLGGYLTMEIVERDQ